MQHRPAQRRRARRQRQQLQDARHIVIGLDPVAQHFHQRLQARNAAQVEQHLVALAGAHLPFPDPLVRLHAQQHHGGGVGGHHHAVGAHQHHAVLHVVDHEPVDQLLQAQLLLARQRQALLRDLAVGQHIHQQRRDHEHQAEQARAQQPGIGLAQQDGVHEGPAHHHQRGDRRGKQREQQAGQRAGFQCRQQEDHGQALGLPAPPQHAEDQRQQGQVGQHLHPHAQMEVPAPQRAGQHRHGNAKIGHGDGHGRRVLDAAQAPEVERHGRDRIRDGGDGGRLAAPHQRKADQQQAHGHAGPAEIAQQAPVEFGRFSLAPQLRQAAPGVQPLPA
ncbi:hypothetical protein D3C72_1114720 [compost metagenome]